MAINREPTTDKDHEELPLYFNNGDLTLLGRAAEKLGFKDEESLLRYAIAVFSAAGTAKLTITEPSGKTTVCTPTEFLLKPAK